MILSSVNTIWVLFGAALVFFMQAGFSMCEAGFTRAKNTGNILMKNLMDFCIGTPCFWLVGFGIMFGAGTSLFGWIDPMIMQDYSHVLPEGVPLWAFAVFQTVFCATSATIFRCNGRTHQIRCVLYLFCCNLLDYLSRLRTLDLGRRMVERTGLPRFCRLNCGAYGRRCLRIDRRKNAGAADR